MRARNATLRARVEEISRHAATNTPLPAETRLSGCTVGSGAFSAASTAVSRSRRASRASSTDRLVSVSSAVKLNDFPLLWLPIHRAVCRGVLRLAEARGRSTQVEFLALGPNAFELCEIRTPVCELLLLGGGSDLGHALLEHLVASSLASATARSMLARRR